MNFRDEAFNLFLTDWNAKTAIISGTDPYRIEWPGVDSGSPPSPREAWARVTYRESRSTQTSFTPGAAKRYTRRGRITVQVFAPLAEGKGTTLAETLSIIARDAFEGKQTPSGVWFHAVTSQDIGRSTSWYQFNVVAEFEYDEIK